MTAVLAVACIFVVLAAEGSTLSCYHCVDALGESCTSNAATCSSSEYVCLTAYIEVTIDGRITKSLVRACEHSESCNQVFSMSHPQLNVWAKATCCNTDNCVPKESSGLPPASTQENGVVCPWCFTNTSSTCSSKQMKSCTGTQNKCIQISGEVLAGGMSFAGAMHGCATENLCVTENAVAILGTAFVKAELRCTNHGNRPEYGLLLAATVGLLLLKAIV